MHVDYPTYHGYAYVNNEWLGQHHTIEEIENFHKWLEGQTVMILSNGEKAYHAYDYERWLNKLTVID